MVAFRERWRTERARMAFRRPTLWRARWGTNVEKGVFGSKKSIHWLKLRTKCWKRNCSSGRSLMGSEECQDWISKSWSRRSLGTLSRRNLFEVSAGEVAVRGPFAGVAVSPFGV